MHNGIVVPINVMQKKSFLKNLFWNKVLDFKGATKLTKDDIERVFALYDRDNNGTIENEELRGFLKDLLELAKKVKLSFFFIYFCLMEWTSLHVYVSLFIWNRDYDICSLSVVLLFVWNWVKMWLNE